MRVTSVHLVTSDPFATGQNLAVPAPQNALCISSGTLSASFVSPPVDILQMNMWAATVTAVGVTGVGYWQVCNDVGNSPYNTTNLTNWVTYPNVDEQFQSGDGVTPNLSTWNMQNQAYHFLRFGWLHQSGTGSIDVSITAKGSG
jgi:hypothetical protein